MSEQRNLVNHRVLLRERPAGRPEPDNFAFDEQPVGRLRPGEVLLETVYMSVDPAMRVWISDEPGYVEPVQIGEVMRAGGIGRVIESENENLKVGDYVQGRLGWQTHPCLDGQSLTKLDLELGTVLDWIGPLGTTALTAYFGLHRVCEITASDTVLVSAAAGGVGQIATQIARIEGCRVIGIAGGPDKCAYLRDELGVDATIDYLAQTDITSAIRAVCPEGVDVYFDNVGGPTLDGALANMRLGARIAICGRISQTASQTLYGVTNLGQLIGKRARLQGFIVSDYAAQFDEARNWLAAQIRSGALKQRMHVLDGLAKAPQGLSMLFRSENTGKLVVQCAPS
ncbi:MAG: NADPH-dependent curcumin reductase CurA [Gammaproteobacteria bacterium]|jgi:NADPH-dependent curcumin reductase CurA